MLFHFRPDRLSVFWRAVYIVCMVVVFSYIFFDVLDLDGSDFRSPLYPAKGSAIAQDVVKDIERCYRLESMEPVGDFLYLPTQSRTNLLLLFQTREVKTSMLDSSWDHGYRVALPRSSPSDSSPAA